MAGMDDDNILAGVANSDDDDGEKSLRLRSMEGGVFNSRLGLNPGRDVVAGVDGNKM